VTFSLTESVINIIVTVLRVAGLPGLFALMTVESFGVPPLPSEVILPFAGFLVASGQFPLGPTVAIALGGALLGAYIAYAVGRWWRHRISGFGFGPVRISDDHLARMDRWFARRGEATVAVARCVPVLRAYISYPAGTARMDAGKFGAYTLVGSVPFILTFLYAGILLGQHWTRVEAELQYVDYALYAAVVVGAIYLVLWLRGRRDSRPTDREASAREPTPPT
jgi:membrane protein DedA with SNARE-associated domain